MKAIIVAALVLILGPIILSFLFEKYHHQDIDASAAYLTRVMGYQEE